MRIRIDVKEVLLFVSFFLITLSNSSYTHNRGLNTPIEYIGIFIVLVGLGCLFVNKKRIKIKFQWGLLFVVLLSFCIGLFMQEMSQEKKVSLIISMIILALIAWIPNGFMASTYSLRTIGWSLTSATIISTVLALVHDISLITQASTGLVVKYGFNGGMAHRNYFGFIMIAAFMCFYSFSKLNHSRKMNSIILFVIVVLLVLSNSKGSYLTFACYYFITQRDKLIKLGREKRRLRNFIMFVIAVIVGYYLFRYFFSEIETFRFRIKGLMNYLDYYYMDYYHVIFGNAEMAFRKSTGMTYDANIRSVVGWDGSTELVVLNVLVKNGIIGFLGYIIIFYRYLKNRFEDIEISNMYIAVVLSFLLSSFVESYVANINMSYTVVVYTLLSSFPYMIHKEDQL